MASERTLLSSLCSGVPHFCRYATIQPAKSCLTTLERKRWQIANYPHTEPNSRLQTNLQIRFSPSVVVSNSEGSWFASLRVCKLSKQCSSSIMWHLGSARTWNGKQQTITRMESNHFDSITVKGKVASLLLVVDRYQTSKTALAPSTGAFYTVSHSKWESQREAPQECKWKSYLSRVNKLEITERPSPFIQAEATKHGVFRYGGPLFRYCDNAREKGRATACCLPAGWSDECVNYWQLRSNYNDDLLDD